MQKSKSVRLQEESRRTLRVFLSSLSDSSDRVHEVLTHDPITLFHFQVCARNLAQGTESGSTSSLEVLLIQLGTVLDQNLIGG